MVLPTRKKLKFMSYIYKEDLIDKSKYSLKCPNVMRCFEFITIHNTANDASAENEVAYMKNNNNSTSFHVAIDDKYVIKAIPFTRNAWHAGDGNGEGNRNSIGIEICYSLSGGERFEQAEKNCIQYVAQLLKEKGWTIQRLKMHYDWSGKNCPHRTKPHWGEFLLEIDNELARIGGITVVNPTPHMQEVAKKQIANIKQLQTVLNQTYNCGLVVDGIIGQKTTEAVNSHIVKNYTANAYAKFIQEQLKDKGYSITVDGKFGSKSESTIKLFQKDNGLTVDGKVGMKTIEKLIW